MSAPPPAPIIAIVTKAPDPARVKTRLTTLSPRARAQLAEAMLEDVVATACAVPGARVVLACDPDPQAAPFPALARRWGAEAVAQPPGDLGARLADLSAALQAGGSPLLFLGSDCPHLPASSLVAALHALSAHDAALGPAEDGGYVLIALARPLPALFRDIPWSSAEVARVTRARAREAGISLAITPGGFDVDRPADLARLAALPPGSAGTRTRKLLENRTLYFGGLEKLG